MILITHLIQANESQGGIWSAVMATRPGLDPAKVKELTLALLDRKLERGLDEQAATDEGDEELD